jgi:hypothetical protein
LADVNRDGWPDLYVACDTTPNLLLVNNRTGGFQEAGTETGLAYGETGLARAGMGVDVAELGPKGELAFIVANYTNEPVSFFREVAPMFFSEETTSVGLAGPTSNTLGFGAFFFDFDNDGLRDLFIANGHVQDDIALFQANLSYEQPHQLFRQREGGQFVDVSNEAGRAITSPRVSRGAAWGDLDNDGDLDILVNNNNGVCEVLRNTQVERGNQQTHWLQVRLRQDQGNRDAIGARVVVRATGRAYGDRVRTGSSYCSASTLRLHFGLGGSARFDDVTVTWPDGRSERFPGGATGRLIQLTRGTGTPVASGPANPFPASGRNRQ